VVNRSIELHLTIVGAFKHMTGNSAIRVEDAAAFIAMFLFFIFAKLIDFGQN